jgi:PKD repeat protein
MKKIYHLLFAMLPASIFAQTTIWSDDFENPSNWTLNTSSGLNEIDANQWFISDAEGGVAPGGCGVASNGNKTLHVGCQGTWCVGSGAVYNAGDGGLGFIYAATNKRSTYNSNISTIGYATLTLKFDWIGIGQANSDFAKIIYSTDNGLTWQDLQPITGGSTCPNSQGLWQTTSINLPAQLNGISNLRLGFNWTNNNDGVGSDPSFAVNNIRIEAPAAPTPPLASFQISDNSICAGSCINFSNTTVGGTTYAWDFGNTVNSTLQNPSNICYDSPGTYQVQMIACNATGCDTVSSAVTVFAAPNDGLLYMNGQISSLQTNALYQWLLCPSLTVIPGATSVNYTPTINGEYAVIVTLANGCSDTSQCVSVGDLSIGEFDYNAVQVYPNPSNGSLKFLMPYDEVSVRVMDQNGRELIRDNVHSNEIVHWNLESGIYFVTFDELSLKPVSVIIE